MLVSLLLAAGGFEWGAVPGAIESAKVSQPTEAAGYPVRIHIVRSSKGFEELLAHFARSFVAAGLYVAPFDRQAQGFRQVRLTGLDPRTQVTYTVLFQLNRDQSTTVLMTEAALAARRPPRGSEAFAPVFPGALSPLVSRLEGSRALLYSVTSASEKELHAFYREVLVSAGYAEQGPGSFARDGEELEVIVSPRRSGPGLSVAVISRPGS